MIWVSPCFGYPRTQIPSVLGIPCRDTQNTESVKYHRQGQVKSSRILLKNHLYSYEALPQQMLRHPRKQDQDLLPKEEPSSTSCNMLLQLATLKFVARQVACGVVIRTTKLCNLHTQCCATSCKEMLLVLLGLNDRMKTRENRGL